MYGQFNMETTAKDLQEAVERMHNCRAELAEIVSASETFQEQTVWEGIVHVFDLIGHSTATRCYAWSSPIGGSKTRRFFAVLHSAPITSARDAVRAAIVQEYRTQNSS
jgi:hypothetical protein